jgi:hypothetical protein
MVERSRRRQEMNDTTTTARMLMATAALAAVGALFAGAANAKPVDIDGGSASAAVTTRAAEPMTIPYLSHGIGVDESLYSGQTLAGVHAALQHSHSTAGESTVTPGLSGDSASTRVSAPEPVGLTGDSAPTRYPGTVTLPATSGGSELDWSSFGIGAGMAALLAAAVASLVLTTRRRGGVALP